MSHSLPDWIGAVDFRPYWSSTYLLAHGQDFSDPSNMDTVERTMTDWDEEYTMIAWFLPTGNLALLPYSLLPFKDATYYWLITNVIIIIISSVKIWDRSTSHSWIPLVGSFSFSMTLLSLIFGQVNTMVLLGVVLFLFFVETKNDYAAGASLILTTIKPHLVILVLPLLLLDTIRQKRWHTIFGFAAAVAGSVIVLFLLYPAWPVSFFDLITSGLRSFRETPTLSGLMVVLNIPSIGKWIWAIALFASLATWCQYGKNWNQKTMVDISIIVGLMVAPVGWSYDQIMLLIPVIHMLEWVANRSLAVGSARIIVLLLVTVNLITFYERALKPRDVWFFWVPLAVGCIYWYAYRHKTSRSTAQITQSNPTQVFS